MLNYKGIASDGKLKVLKVTRSVLPPSSNKLMEIDGKSGALFISKKHGVKKIEVEVAILGDYVSKKRDIADWLDADKPEALILSDEPDKTDFALIDGDTDMDEILDNGFGTITFICPDPYSVGADRTVNAGTINYGGTAETFPVVTATATASASQFSITNGDDNVTVNAPVVAGDVLMIDMSKGKVTKNGTLIMSTVTFESEFWSLKKGTNTVTSSAGFTTVLDFKERFK
jgi:predicted phage tail component-like protein